MGGGGGGLDLGGMGGGSSEPISEPATGGAESPAPGGEEGAPMNESFKRKLGFIVKDDLIESVDDLIDFTKPQKNINEITNKLNDMLNQ
jgi:hypothetical protein